MGILMPLDHPTGALNRDLPTCRVQHTTQSDEQIPDKNLPILAVYNGIHHYCSSRPKALNFMDGVDEIAESLDGVVQLCEHLSQYVGDQKVSEVINNIKQTSNLCLNSALQIFRPVKPVPPTKKPVKRFKSTTLCKPYIDPWEPEHCECGILFKSEQEMMEHRVKAHMKTNQWKCSKCKKLFSKDQSLKVHFRRVHMKIFRYQCTMCDKGVDSPQRFDMHMAKEHKGTKNYQCQFCQKEWASKEALRRHETSCRTTTTFPCQYCGVLYKNSSNLQKHYHKFHSVQKGDNNMNIMACPQCHKLFSDAENYKHHFTRTRCGQNLKEELMATGEIYEGIDEDELCADTKEDLEDEEELEEAL